MSYAVYFDGVLVAGSGFSGKDLIEPHLHLEEGGAGEFTFKLHPEHEFYNMPKERKTEVRVFLREEDEFPIWCGYASNISYDFWMNKSVVVEGDLACFADSVIYPFDYNTMTPGAFLSEVVDEYNARCSTNKHIYLEEVSVTGRLPEGEIDYDSGIDALGILTENFGGVFVVSYGNVNGQFTKTLNYLKETDFGTSSQTIELGQNLMDLDINIESSDIATCIIPLGKKTEVDGSMPTYVTIESVNGGDKSLQSSAGVQNFGKIWRTVRFENVRKPSTLLTKAQNYLNNYQFASMVIKANAIDLSLAYDAFESLKLSQSVRIISHYHGMDATFRITEMDYYLNEPERNTITCGHSGVHTLTGLVSGKKLSKLRTDSDGQQFYPNPNIGTETEVNYNDIRQEANDMLVIYRLRNVPVQVGDTLTIK